ncbi:MAG: hypothetical protein J6Z15_05185 [Oscillospiraceae bacterium]|nr:hypothetical protein [Oscillospiraceae bacterium]
MKLIIPAICNLVIIHYPVSFRQRFSGGFGVLFTFISQASFFGIPRAEGECGVSGRSPPDFQERDEQKIRRMRCEDVSQNMQKNTLLEHKLWYNTEKEPDWSD